MAAGPGRRSSWVGDFRTIKIVIAAVKHRLLSGAPPMRSSRSLAVVILTLTAAGSLAAQNRPSDRRRFIAPNTPVSDDPRRVPVSGAPQGPPGTFVLRGGRLFDGTGAAAREAT